MADLKTLGKYYLLSSLPVLYSLSDEDKSYIAEKAILKDLKRNEYLYKQGSPFDYFYILVNGSIELVNHVRVDNEEKQVSVEVMRKGDFLGVVSMMGGKPHTFSAKALGDVKLLLLSQEDFNDVMNRVPALGVVISRVLARRLKASPDESDRKIIESNVIAVHCDKNPSLGAHFALELSEHIINETGKKSIVLRFNKKKEHLIHASSKVKNYDFDDIDAILNQYHKYRYSYHFIILDLPEDKPELCKVLLQESDHCFLITEPELKDKSVFLKQYELENTNDVNFISNVILKESIKSSELNSIARKLARKISGMRLGLALGGGAAFGLAQIGVLKVLERENITVDLVSGTSIGSLVGALWASGVSASEIEKATEEFDSLFNMLKLMDFSIMPTKGLISGNNIRKFLEGFLGHRTFQELPMELRTITCDINTRQEVISKEGSVVDAVMASTAIPGLFNPLVTPKGVYVDGGVVNPLPVSALTIEGVQRIIAVNAMPSPEDVVKSNKKDQSLMDIFINSFYSLQYRLCKYSFQSSDVYMSPILPNSSWYEFYRAKEFIALGEKVCEENLKEIKNLAFKSS
ncbi:MAG TPA: patatin-like phospholipase family protein [Leptospiraceae bacterium]|nr:patatin-like phospholipase family protein [Leptospiraceae bacterium]HMW03926.1 patatin-like phospholipase family protein [Leptospiraceae bacterium]HMX33145.1 patatin-like phospholipase family protein [Leptospiraceae bacterium]HMY29906.1 patatin-like phospholipase family protein [Leptospiraceae bacterium]HMZ62950.1 patatin-like phospholipase family protein [Leptospiraceae bacterium]